MNEDRNLQVVSYGHDDLNAALAWVVQTHDRDFDGQEHVEITIRPEWWPADEKWVWTASVSGSTSVVREDA